MLYTFNTTCNTFTYLHIWHLHIVSTAFYCWIFYTKLLISTTYKISDWYFISVHWNPHCCRLDGEHYTTAAGRKSHCSVATPSHIDTGRGRHQSFTNSFKYERVLVVSAKGRRWSWPEALNEGRADRRMGGEGPPHHRDSSFWVPHINPAANTPGQPTRWRQH